MVINIKIDRLIAILATFSVISLFHCELTHASTASPDSSTNTSSITLRSTKSDLLPMGRNVEKNIVIVQLLMKEGMPNIAKKFLYDALEAYQSVKDTAGTRRILLELARFHREANDTEKSLQYYEKYFSEKGIPEKDYEKDVGILVESLAGLGKKNASLKYEYIQKVKRKCHPVFATRNAEYFSLIMADCLTSMNKPEEAYLLYLQASTAKKQSIKKEALKKINSWSEEKKRSFRNSLAESIDNKKKQVIYIFAVLGISIIAFIGAGYIGLKKFELKRKLLLGAKYFDWELYEKSAEQFESILKSTPGHVRAQQMLKEIENKKGIILNNLPHKMATPLFKKAVAWMPFHYTASWAIICQVLFFSTYLALRYFEEKVDFVLLLVFGSLGVFCCATGLIWASKILEMSKEKISSFVDLDRRSFDEWYQFYMDTLFDRNGLFVAGGIGLAAVLLYIIYIVGGIWPLSLEGKITLSLFTFFSVFIMGFTITSIFPYVFMINEVADLPLITNNKSSDIKEIGEISLKFTLVGVAIYMSYLLGCLYGLPIVIQIQLVEICILPILLVFFIVPQLRIHKIMVANKESLQRNIEIQIEALAAKFDKEPDEKTAQLLRGMRERYLDVEENPEWPFNTQALMSVFISVIIPFTFLMIELFFKG